MTAIPWPLLLEHVGATITQAANARVTNRSAALHGADEFRARLWEEGFICDCLDTMNCWYFAIILKTSAERNEVKVHYDGWPPKYDEWIDADSHRLQPFLSRARLNARPHLTRPHPGHAIHSINLDSLLGVRHAAANGGDAASAGSLPPGAQPSPASSQYTPSAANLAAGSSSWQDTRQLAFDLSAAIATMGEQRADANGAGRLDCSPQLHAFALKLHHAIDGSSGSDGVAGSLQPVQYAAGAKAASPVMIPVSLTVSAHGGLSSTGSSAIAAASAAGILPHPSHFMTQSVSSLSCLADLSRRNHSFLDEVSRAYKSELTRTLAKLDGENFRSGLAVQTFRHLPFALGQAFDPQPAGSVPRSLQLKVDASSSLPVCSYLLLLIQQQLLHRDMLPSTRELVRVSAARPRGRIASMHSLVPLGMGERSFVREVRDFLSRLIELPLELYEAASAQADVHRLRRSALITSVQLAFALSTQESVLESTLCLLRYFRPLLHASSDDADAVPDDPSAERELLMSLASLTQRWAEFAVHDALRLLGQQRDEVASSLSEARLPTLQTPPPAIAAAGHSALTTAAGADAATVQPAATPSLPAAVVPRWADIAAAATASPPSLPLFPAAAALVGCPLLHPPGPASECVRLCSDASGAFLYVLSSDYGLLKLGSGENGTIAGQAIRQNVALALHAPFAHIAFLPLPRSARSGTRGHLLLRSQLCPNQLLLIDSETLHLTGAHVPLTGVSHGSAAPSAAAPPSWALTYGAAVASSLTGPPVTSGGYDPSNFPPLVLPPTWREDVATEGFICDACDAHGSWYPAQVIAVNRDGGRVVVTVRFDGWSQQHNEQIDIDSGRLAPFASRINTLQRFSKSNQTGSHLLDLSSAVRAHKRATGRDLFVSPNLNTPEFRSGLHVGSIVDARDSSEMWYAAKIVKIDGDTVTVTYDGWKAEYNEAVPLTSMRLAPFLSQTSLAMRLQDPQQSERLALDLSAAIAEVRGLTNRDVALMDDPRLTPAFLALFEQAVIRASAWTVGSVWPLTDGQPDLCLQMETTGLSLVDTARNTRRRVYLTVPQQQGIEEQSLAASSPASTSADSASVSSASGAAPSVAASSASPLSSTSKPDSAAAASRVLTSAEATSLRSIADASLPFFFVQSASPSDPAHLVLLCLRADGVRFRGVWLNIDLENIAASSARVKETPVLLKSVDLQDTLPTQLVAKDASVSKKDAASSKATEATRDLDRYCSGCGTFLTAPLSYPLPALPAPPGTLSLPPSHVQLNSPGVASFLRCSHPTCEKQKLLLCTQCHQFGSYPHPHDEGHVLTRLENPPVSDKGADSASAASDAAVLVSTSAQAVFGLFDERDDTIILAPFVPFSSTGTGLVAGVRSLDFRCFSSHSGALLAAPMPQSNAAALFVHCPLVDEALAPAFVNPRATEATIFKINARGMLSRSVWTHKLKQNNPRRCPDALLFQLPSEHTSSLEVLSLLLAQLLSSVAVAEQNQEQLFNNFGRISLVVHEVGKLYRAARRVSSAAFSAPTYFAAVERVFSCALHLLAAYLQQLCTVWPLIRPENPTSSRAMRDGLQAHKRQLKLLLLEQLFMGLLHEKDVAAPQLHSCSTEVRLLLVHLASFLAFWHDSWLQRASFIQALIDALPSSRASAAVGLSSASSSLSTQDVSASAGGASSPPPNSSRVPISTDGDECSLAFLTLRHLLHSNLLKSWAGNPAGHSSAPTEHAVFVELEMNSVDMALQTTSSSAAVDDAASIPMPQPAAVAASIFGSAFGDLLDGFLAYLWTPAVDASSAQLTVPQLVLTHVLLAFQFHLLRMVPSPLALVQASALSAASNGSSSGIAAGATSKASNVLPGSTTVQFSQAKPSAALLVRLMTSILTHFGDSLVAPRAPSKPFRLANPLLQLYSFSALQLARTNLKLVAAPEIIALLPVLFDITHALEELFPARSSSAASETSASTVEIEAACATVDASAATRLMPNSAGRLANVGSLIKTSLVALLHVLYPPAADDKSFAAEAATTVVSVAEAETAGLNKQALVAHLGELSNVASVPLAPQLQQFLRKFIACSKESVRKPSPPPSASAIPDAMPLAPEAVFSQLLQVCLLEMGGGAAQLDLAFAWPAEVATAACLMRYTLVGEGSGSELSSPRKGDATSSSTASNTLLLDLCYHFALSISPSVLLAKTRRKNMRILAQADTPSWFRQLVARIFEHARTPLLERMRAQEQRVQEQQAADALSAMAAPREPSPVALSENKEAPEVFRARSASPIVLLSEIPTEADGEKVQADSSTRSVVAQWLQNATFLLTNDFSGARNSNGTDSTPASFRMTPMFTAQLSTPSRSPRPTPLVPLEQLGDMTLGATADSIRGHAMSLLSSSGAVTDDDVSSNDDDDDGESSHTDIPLLRSLSDRMPSSSPSASPATSGVFGRALLPLEGALLSSAGSHAAGVSASTAAHAMFVRRSRRFALHGSSGWLISLVQQLSSHDRVRVEEYMLARQNAFRLTQARVDLLNKLNSHLSASGDEVMRAVSDGAAARGSPSEPHVMPLTRLTDRSIVMDLFLPLLWSTLSSQNGVTSTTAANAPAAPSSANSRVHLLYPNASIAQLNENAARAGHRDSDDQTTLGSFLRTLASWLDTTLAVLDAPVDANSRSDGESPAQSPVLHARLRLVLHFLGQEFSTVRDKATLLNSGVLASLVRFTFHEKAVAQLNDLTRIAWATFSMLIANVLAPASDGLASKPADALALSMSSSLMSALRPLQEAIVNHIFGICSDIPSFNAVQLLPATELLSQAQRVVPAPLDLDTVKVGTLLDGCDRAQSWFCAVVKKIEQRVGGPHCFVAFSGWPPSQDEWIPLRSGKLAALFSHVDVQTEANARPSKHRLDLSAQIAEFKARQAQPVSDEVKLLANANLSSVQSNLNERINRTTNMLRILRAVAPMASLPTAHPSSITASPRLIALPTAASSSTLSSLCLLSNFLRMLTAAPAQRAPPMILQLELLSFLRKSLCFRFLPSDFDVAAATNGSCMTAEQVVHQMLRLLGSTLWSARALSSQPGLQAVQAVFVPVDSASGLGVPSGERTTLNQSWLWQSHFEAALHVTDGQRRLQEFVLQFMHDCWLAPPAQQVDNAGTGRQWSRIVLAAVENALQTLPGVMATLLEQNSRASEASDSLGLLDAPFFELQTSLKFLSGLECFLRPGSRISLRLSDASENCDLDSHQTLVANALDASADEELPTRTDAFDLSGVLHGFVRSFAHAPNSTLGCSPFLTVEVLRELDASADPDDTSANATDLQLCGNSKYNAESAAVALGAASTVTYTTLPSTMSRVRPLPARHLSLAKLLPESSNAKLQAILVELLRQAAKRQDAHKLPHTTASLQLLQLQFETLRALQSQLSSSGGWRMDPPELASLLFDLLAATAPEHASIDLDLSPAMVPRTDLFMQALTLQHSRVFQLEQEVLHSPKHMLIPPSLLSLVDVPTHAGATGAAAKATKASKDSPAAAVVEDVPQPPLLTAIANIELMGYTAQQAKAALVHNGSIDMVAAMELILSEHPAVARVVSEAQWNEFVERQGARLPIERYLRQQALKAQGADAAESQASPVSVVTAPVMLPARPRNFSPENIFLGPVAAAGGQDLSGQPLHRTPLACVVATGCNVVGLPVALKATVSTALPHCTLQNGIIVKVVPAISAAASSAAAAAPASASAISVSAESQAVQTVDAIRGAVLVRFSGSLRSTQPVPSVYAWLSVSELLVEPLSPFELSAGSLALALTHRREQLERQARVACVQGMHRVAKTMLAQIARQAMRACFSSASPFPRFSLLQLLDILPVPTHPIDCAPAIVKPVSKQRAKMVESVLAYLLRGEESMPASSADMGTAHFDRMLQELESVLDPLSFAIDAHVSMPLTSSTPLCLRPVAPPAAATASASASSEPAPIPGLVQVCFRSDAWARASNSSHVLTFYSDAAHTRLLRQVIFPTQEPLHVIGKTIVPPAPFVLPTPCFVTFVDGVNDEPLLPRSLPPDSPPVSSGHDLLSALVHVTPFTLERLNHAAFLVDAITYAMTNAARHNGVVLSSRQKQILQTRIGFPLFDRLLTLFTDTLRTHELLPSNIAFTCVRLLTQLMTLWSGSSVSILPAQMRGALRGTASALEVSKAPQMANAFAAVASAGEDSGAALQSFPSASAVPSLFVRSLWLDTVLCSQLLNGSHMAALQAFGHSPYHASVLECMVAWRLLASAHTSQVAPSNFTDPLKFDVLWSGAHLRPLRCHQHREELAEKEAAVRARQEELRAFAATHVGVPSGVSNASEEDGLQRSDLLLNLMMAKAELLHVINAALSPELHAVENCVHLVRRAMGLPKRISTAKLPGLSQVQALRNLSVTSSADATATTRVFLAHAFGSLLNRASSRSGAPAASGDSNSAAASDVPAAALSATPDATSTCQLCDGSAAFRCVQCGLELCRGCDEDWHQPDRLQLHERIPVTYAPSPHASRPTVASAASSAGLSSSPSSVPTSSSDWPCPVCHAVNFGVLRVCHACTTPRLVEEHERAAHAAEMQALLRDLPSTAAPTAASIAAAAPSDALAAATGPLSANASEDGDEEGSIDVTTDDEADAREAAPGSAGSAVASALPLDSSGKLPPEEQLKLDSATLQYFDLPHSLIGELLLGAQMEGARWMGIRATTPDNAASAACASSAAPAARADVVTSASASSDETSAATAPAQERDDSKLSESDARSSTTLRQPLAALLLPSSPARLQLFHGLLTATRERDRIVPDFAFDTSQRWQERLNDSSAADKAAAAGAKQPAEGVAARPAAKLSLFEQLFAQLSSISPVQLRGPVGEYSWRTAFSGAADEGAQGYVGMYKQAIAALSIELARAALQNGSEPAPLLMVCPNGTNEVGSNRNQLIVNPALVGIAHLKRFYVLGELLGCAVRSSTCIPLDLSRVFWKTLMYGVDALLAGPLEQALRNGLRDLKSFDANAATMLSYVLSEGDRDAFDALSLRWTCFLSGGALVDLFPGGSHRVVRFEERAQYVRLALHARLNESSAALQAIRFGMRAVIPSTSPSSTSTRLFGGDGLSDFLPSPSGPLHLLRAEELELLVVGSPEVDLALLRAHTIYKNCSADSQVVRYFWTVLEEFSVADRARFLQFAWGRARLPANFGAAHQHMTLNVVDLPLWWRKQHPTLVGGAAEEASPVTLEQASGLRLPKSQTCFFLVDLPNYPSLSVLRHKLTLALECTDINF